MPEWRQIEFEVARTQSVWLFHQRCALLAGVAGIWGVVVASIIGSAGWCEFFNLNWVAIRDGSAEALDGVFVAKGDERRNVVNEKRRKPVSRAFIFLVPLTALALCVCVGHHNWLHHAGNSVARGVPFVGSYTCDAVLWVQNSKVKSPCVRNANVIVFFTHGTWTKEVNICEIRGE